MTDSELFVFGSFTADETRSLLQKRPSGNAENNVAKTDLQFGSLNFGNGITFGNFYGEAKQPWGPSNGRIPSVPSKSVKEEKELYVDKEAVHSPRTNGSLEGCEAKQALDPSNVRVSSPPANSVKEEKDLNNAKEAGHSARANGSLEGSRSITQSSSGSPFSNDFEDVKIEDFSFQSSSSSETEEELKNQSQSSNFHVLGNCSMENLQDRTNNGLTMHVAKEAVWKATHDPSNLAKSLLPRGLVNSGNTCFLNASLQALLSCSPFVQLLQDLRIRDVPKVGFPTLTAFAEFISNFKMPVSSACKKDMALIESGRAFAPVMFEVVLQKFTPDVPKGISGRPRQEDAQEFLSFIMDQMHDELLKLSGQSSLMNGAKSSLISYPDDDEWETVGPKNKSAVTRTQSFVSSELSHIFGGQLRSVVKARGNKASATVQPFLLLHLDIHPDVVHTIEDALHLFCLPENLEGYRASAMGKAGVVAARKSIQIKSLSKIMILHLMRFSYGSQGSAKLHKPVRFPLEFMLARELLVSPSTESRRYELVATITHHGRDPSKGHYTADARCPNGQWLRFDDASVTAIPTGKVLHNQAYVVFYKQV